MIFSALVLGVVVLGLFLARGRKRRPYSSNYPPCPVPFPLLGHLPHLTMAGKHILEVAKDHAALYGPVTSLSLGPVEIVILHDAKLIREMLHSENAAGRASTMMGFTKRKSWGRAMGLIDPDAGAEWRERKRFFLRTLRDFGFGKRAEDSVREQAQVVVEEMLAESVTCDGHLLIKDNFNIPVANIIWKMVANKTYGPDSSEGLQLISLMDELFSKRLSFVNIVPGLRLLAHRESNRRNQLFAEMRQIFFRCIEEHEESRDENEPRDVIDAYLAEIHRCSPGYDKGHLVISIMDLFAAGSETTSTTLRWAILFLIRHPEVQRQCAAEMESLGADRPVTLEDMELLPYCWATVLEVLRMGAIAPGTLAHRATTTINLGGYTIPQDTIILSNFLYSHRDPKYWQDPDQFRPDRFLDEATDDGSDTVRRVVREPEFFVPFGTGKRVCMGEKMARVELFIFFTYLVQKLEFLAPSGAREKIMPDPGRYVIGITKIPDAYHCKIRSRV